MTKLSIEDQALCEALDEFTCNADDLIGNYGYTPQQVLEALRTDKCWPDDHEDEQGMIVTKWEPFEYHDGFAVASMVEDATHSHELKLKAAAKKIRKAVRAERSKFVKVLKNLKSIFETNMNVDWLDAELTPSEEFEAILDDYINPALKLARRT